MNYATGYAFNTKHIFENFDIKRLKMRNRDLKGKRRDELMISVFIYSVKLILIDIFTNNHTFILPSTRRAKIEIQGVFDEKFKKAKRNGKFKDFDAYKTNFAGYEPKFIFYSGGVEKKKDIHVSKFLQQILIDNANNNINYF